MPNKNLTNTAKNQAKENQIIIYEGDDGKNYEIEHYNLGLIISLGYRIKSHVATRFRIWATKRLKEYIIKGFTMDDERLKNLGGGGY